jgi:voltage-gated potassium channel
MLILIFTAFLLIAVTIIIHGYGTMTWLRYLVARKTLADGQIRPANVLRVLISTAIVLITLHIIEIFVWALAYLLVVPDGELQTLESAFYFSAVTFTTLGYGDITLSSDWRLLSGLQAIDGILLIGWTTAFLFAVLQRAWIRPGDNKKSQK